MARGWESKSVEAQIDMAAQNPRVAAALQKAPDPNKLDRIRQKESLLLSRTRVVHELKTAQNPRYKAVLTKALADLDAKLSTIAD
jgi:hypothetical protein